MNSNWARQTRSRHDVAPLRECSTRWPAETTRTTRNAYSIDIRRQLLSTSAETIGTQALLYILGCMVVHLRQYARLVKSQLSSIREPPSAVSAVLQYYQLSIALPLSLGCYVICLAFQLEPGIFFTLRFYGATRADTLTRSYDSSSISITHLNNFFSSPVPSRIRSINLKLCCPRRAL